MACLKCITVAVFSLTALAVEVLCILYGVYALVPESPWKKRDVTAGVMLLVLSAPISVLVALIVAMPLVVIGVCLEEDDGRG